MTLESRSKSRSESQAESRSKSRPQSRSESSSASRSDDGLSSTRVRMTQRTASGWTMTAWSRKVFLRRRRRDRLLRRSRQQPSSRGRQLSSKVHRELRAARSRRSTRRCQWTREAQSGSRNRSRGQCCGMRQRWPQRGHRQAHPAAGRDFARRGRSRKTRAREIARRGRAKKTRRAKSRAEDARFLGGPARHGDRRGYRRRLGDDAAKR